MVVVVVTRKREKIMPTTPTTSLSATYVSRLGSGRGLLFNWGVVNAAISLAGGEIHRPPHNHFHFSIRWTVKEAEEMGTISNVLKNKIKLYKNFQLIRNKSTCLFKALKDLKNVTNRTCIQWTQHTANG